MRFSSNFAVSKASAADDANWPTQAGHALCIQFSGIQEYSPWWFKSPPGPSPGQNEGSLPLFPVCRGL